MVGIAIFKTNHFTALYDLVLSMLWTLYRQNMCHYKYKIPTVKYMGDSIPFINRYGKYLSPSFLN